jgi:hypothetical protein
MPPSMEQISVKKTMAWFFDIRPPPSISQHSLN